MAVASSVQGVSGKLSEAWRLKDYFVEYNDCEIEEAEFVDYECVYGGKTVQGVLTFIDNKGYTSGLNKKTTVMSVGGFIKINYTDAYGCVTKQEFTITKINTSVDKKTQKMVSLILQDTASRNMMGSFVSKGYPGEKYSDVITKHLKELKVMDLLVDPPDAEEAINMVIPGHKDFFSVLMQTAEDRNYSLRVDRFAKYFVHKSKQEFNLLKSTKETFEYDAKPLSLAKIIQYDIKGYDVNAYLASVTTKDLAIDQRTANSPDNKDGLDGKEEKREARESKNDGMIGKGVKTSEGIATRGAKQKTRSHTEREYFSSLSKANEAQIWVPGRNLNRIGMTVEVNFPRPKYYDSSEYDKEFSADWEVVAVRDKIIGWYFVQEIFLRRPGKKG